MKKKAGKRKKVVKTGKADKTKLKKPDKTNERGFGTESLGDDYWDRVADDVASGYKNEKDEDRLLNEDQQPDDHERGDKAEAEQ